MYFEFLSTPEEQAQLLNDFKNKRCSSKTDKINPEWLADKFYIVSFETTTDVTSGYVRIYPHDDLYQFDKQTLTVIKNIPKHQAVTLKFGAL